MAATGSRRGKNRPGLCFKFRDGSCEKGSKCRYAHQSSELAYQQAPYHPMQYGYPGYAWPMMGPAPGMGPMMGYPMWPHWQASAPSDHAPGNTSKKEEKQTHKEKKRKKETRDDGGKEDAGGKEKKTRRRKSAVRKRGASDSDCNSSCSAETKKHCVSGEALDFKKNMAMLRAEDVSQKIILRSLGLDEVGYLGTFHEAGLKHDPAYSSAFHQFCTRHGILLLDRDSHTKQFITKFVEGAILDFSEKEWALKAIEQIKAGTKEPKESPNIYLEPPKKDSKECRNIYLQDLP
eukprot:TRINITY_DN79178_c0_g1_i1.p1 TRINITY_DN79178_c0_g1~~TRINITY_DN79178_c0_g1_i1.p1  ORF type:complete len:301 (+),score=44.77 TRINITY_DN79178_c0_g1_i1:31-903(+)